MRMLTGREDDVAQGVMEGRSNKEIAHFLAISPRTVEHHLTSIFRKLGVSSRTALLAKLGRPAIEGSAASPAQAPVATSYAVSDGARIAYQVVGEGPEDLVLVPGFVSNVDIGWTWPALAAFQFMLASLHRLVLFDKRGTGLSDPVPSPAHLSLSHRMDELRAVMDAARCRRATVFGFSEGAALAMLLAVTYPGRVERLILWGARVTGGSDPDDPTSRSLADDSAERWRRIQEEWGTGRYLAPFIPSLAGDPVSLDHIARFERHGASPASVFETVRLAGEGDVRNLCSAIGVPTLVLHRLNDRLVPVAHGRYLARNIPGASYVELEGGDHPPWVGDTERVGREITDFLRRPVRQVG
jgi:pimeloyl-ACP methyl ester carboxylesterase/DNA-binding CsgD family transcriptional regulator